MSKNSKFKKTPIPHRSKFGEPMTYFILSEDGKQHTQVTRKECLAATDEPTNLYQQRWFVDEESGFVVRLPRNANCEEIARENMRYIWREQKQQERKCECIYKGTTKCSGWETAPDGTRECDYCQRKNVSRTVELDMFFQDDGNSESFTPQFEPADDFDITSFLEDKSLLDTLYSALAALTSEEKSLIKDIFWQSKTERQIAPKLGLKEPKSVNKRKQRILEILRRNKDLKNFFK